jgi:hypothetical protein
VFAVPMMCRMRTGATSPTVWSRLTRSRGASIGAGIVLCVEALWSPIVWWGTFIVGAFVSLGTEKGQVAWIDAMQRLGSWGPLVLLVPLVGAAVAVLGRPSRPRALWAVLCLVAAVLNLLAAVPLVIYNVGHTVGPVAPRVFGVGLGLAFGLVAARVFADGVVYLRRPVPLALPPPPPT